MRALANNFDEMCPEIIAGEVVMMAPPAIRHVQVAGNIYRIFSNFLRHRRCRAFPDGMALYFEDGDMFIPDGMIVCDKSKIRADGVHGAPDLVVEVLSPSSVNRDRGVKKAAYERIGVREYWIVNPLSKEIEVYRQKESSLVLDHVYVIFPDWEWERLSAEERAAARLTVKVSLYDDLVIDIREVFELAD